MPKPATTVAAYLDSLPDGVRREVERVREAIHRKLPRGYEEGIRCGIIAWSVPPSVFPNGHPGAPERPMPFAALAGRKNGVSVAFLTHYADREEWARFQRAWKTTGERLDVGACCVRFQEAKDSTLRLLGDVVARTPVKRYVECYLGMLKNMGKGKGKGKGTGKGKGKGKDATPAPRRPGAAKAKRVARTR